MTFETVEVRNAVNVGNVQISIPSSRFLQQAGKTECILKYQPIELVLDNALINCFLKHNFRQRGKTIFFGDWPNLFVFFFVL